MAHAQNCQVLFQLMILPVMREKEVGLPVRLGPALILPRGQTVRLQAAPDSLSLTSESLQSTVLSANNTCLISLKQHIRRKHPEIQIKEAIIHPQ